MRNFAHSEIDPLVPNLKLVYYNGIIDTVYVVGTRFM